MIEKAPEISMFYFLQFEQDPLYVQSKPLIEKINDKYEYWDSVKYKKCPEGCSSEQLWRFVKCSRMLKNVKIGDKYGINLCITDHMQWMCHEFDMNFEIPHNDFLYD